MQIELELLAPAKNKSIGIAAINCGADAVYIAGPKFGAREAAGNSIPDIAELVSYAHAYKAKVYMVVNTILYDNELAQAREIIRQAYEAGCDAIIVQDLSILKMDLPPIPLFASTQTNIRTVEQARFLESAGFERLILARELSLQQISAIRAATRVPLEAFVHGALCVSYSGQCYLSQKLTGRSANRGACAQACRSNYTLIDSTGKILIKDSPLLSLKDLNLSAKIPQLVEAGITSFKIEGRLKNESYIKNTVLLYRREIDKFLAAGNAYKKASYGECRGGFIPNSGYTFNRGYTRLFIEGERDTWRSEDGAKYMGEYIGKITGCKNNANGTGQFTYAPATGTLRLQNGDGLCFVTPSGNIEGTRANACYGRVVATAEKINLPAQTRIYRNYNISFEKELERNMPKRVIPAELLFTVSEKGGPVLDVTCENTITFRHPVEPGEPATNTELAEKTIRAQFSKSADIFSFTFRGFKDATPPFYPVATLNRIRREIAGKLAGYIAEKATERNIRQNAPLYTAPFRGKKLTYLANCSNRIARNLYISMGAGEVSPAYELNPPQEAELMRTKYCIRYELGCCTKNGKKLNEPLFLLNGKSKLRLRFDCENCEMVILG